VLPASLVGNWKAEIARFAADPKSAMGSVDLVVTTYSMLLRQDGLLAHRWRLVVLDEAQAIKIWGPGRQNSFSGSGPTPASP